MDDDGVPLLLLTLSAIDSVGMTVGCLRMDFGFCCRMDEVGDVTINLRDEPASKGILRCRRCQTAPLELHQSAPLEVPQYAPLENGPGVVFDFQGGVHR